MKPIAGYKDYLINLDGMVYSTKHDKIRVMKPQLNKWKYPSVRLWDHGNNTRLRVHVLMAENFLPERPSVAHVVRHLDGDKTNNHILNLAWGTQWDNMQDMKRHKKEREG